jgi:hypothetical protein
MKTRVFTQIGAFGVLSAGFLAGTRPAHDSAPFSAVLTGVVKTTITGDARFGLVRGGSSAPDVFTLTLGADNPGGAGAVLFTQSNGEGLRVGSYPIREVGARESNLHALVVIGTAYAPEGVFRATTGTLTITSISDSEINGVFSVQAIGFLASAPDQENQPVSVSGSFTARRTDSGWKAQAF